MADSSPGAPAPASNQPSAPLSASTSAPASVPRPGPDMRFPLLPAAGVFVVATLIYFVCFGALEHLRNRKGPWTVEFATDPSGEPSLTIRQAALGIQDFRFVFIGEQHTNRSLQATVVLDKPLKPLPFGERISEDLMFLPGTEALQLFGHEIEWAPRTLVVNRKEVAWKPQQVIRLTAAEKLPPETLKPASPKKRPIL